MTIQRMTQIEYYIANQENQKRDFASYHLDNDVEDDKGIWWTNKEKPYRTEGDSPSLQIPFVKRNAEVIPREFRDLGNGKDPISNKRIRQTQKKNQSIAYDLQFACPKSVSVLYGLSQTEEQKKKFEDIQRRAVMRALDFADANGYIITRRGKGGKIQERPEELLCATFLHTTSRSGDPQLHTHSVMLNVCRRKDGTTGTIDNVVLMNHQAEMGAVYRLALCEMLETELGIKTEKDGRNFKVKGFPKNIEELFSKRRSKIEEEAFKEGITTANDRQKAGFIALNTRGSKKEIPPKEKLKQKWEMELSSNGWTKEEIWNTVSYNSERENDDIKTKKETAINAIEELQKSESALEQRKVDAVILEHLQGICSLDDALKTIKEIKEDGTIIEIGENEKGKVFATSFMIEKEQSVLRNSIERQNEREWVPSSSVEQVIAKRTTMSEEQADAVRHALNNDGVSAIEGSAGTGKSFSLGTVTECARDVGFRVHVIAPSHKAKDVLKSDTNSANEDAQTVRGFLNRITNEEHKEHIPLCGMDCVVLDEAGMVGTEEMSELLEVTRAKGVKVILAGDTRQLQPVGAGAPMSIIADTCGTQRISKIRRQKVEWQREASENFARGDTASALASYEDQGRIKTGTKDEAIEQLTRDWKADVQDNPDGTRVVLATRNSDVKLLNESLRLQAREAGILKGEEITVQAMTRGQFGHVADLAIATGDRLIFGETVSIEGTQINNSDQGTVVGITTGNGQEPMVSIEMDKGGTVTAPWSEFARKPGRDEERGPVKCQHAYAVTVHASQGMTVDHAFVLNSEGMGQESAYVAMTRHRQDCTMYVNSARLEDRVANMTSENKFEIYKDGRTKGKDSGDEEEAVREEVPREEVMKLLYQECSKKDIKTNISDFVLNKKEWAGIQNEVLHELPKNIQQNEKSLMSKIVSDARKELEQKREQELQKSEQKNRAIPIHSL